MLLVYLATSLINESIDIEFVEPNILVRNRTQCTRMIRTKKKKKAKANMVGEETNKTNRKKGNPRKRIVWKFE